MTERPNLAAAFGGGAKDTHNRASSLTGLLAPRTATPPTAPAVTGTPEAAAPKPPAAPKAAAAPADADVDGKVTSVPAYIEPAVLQLATAAIRSRGITYDALLVEAFEKVGDDRLRTLFAPKPADAATAMPGRVRAPRGTAGIQRQFRLDPDQRAWIAEKQAAVRAPSRSALIAGALKLHLTTD